MAQSPAGSAVKALQLELKKIQAEPVEGFRVKLANDDNIFEWEVAIFGPPGTLYEGGYFKVIVLEQCFLKLSIEIMVFGYFRTSVLKVFLIIIKLRQKVYHTKSDVVHIASRKTQNVSEKMVMV